jgi:sulfhydrogenase subunit beta (sulfur reductase)
VVYSDKLYAISFDKFKTLVSNLCKESTVIGPKKKNRSTVFLPIDNYDELVLDKICDYPLKYVYMPNGDVFFDFDSNEITLPQKCSEEKIIIGARKCDLNAVVHHDKAYNHKFEDEYYTSKRNNLFFIGIHCDGGMDEYCFCESLGKDYFFDLMLYKRSDHYLVEMGSKKGEDFISSHNNLFDSTDYNLTDEDRKMNTDRLKNKDMSVLYNNSKWEELSKKCISCGACNLMCASCFCFDIVDEVNFDLKSGKRIRKPASCQLRCFSRVAGENHFRDKKIERYKHRIYHQLQYFKDRHGINLCTGCGRCIRHCPNKIDFVSAINEMK